MYSTLFHIHRRLFCCSSKILPTGCFVHETAVVIGSVSLSKDASVWPNVTIRGGTKDVNTIDIGEGSNIQDGTVIHCSGNWRSESHPGYSTKIGKNVTVGHKALLHGCAIEDDVLIGMGCIVMDGAQIKSNVILGAGSLVPPGKILTPGLWVGSPAVFKREITNEEHELIRGNAKHYIWLKDRYLKGDGKNFNIHHYPTFRNERE